MKKTLNEFLIPEYYEKFQCKMGKCRSSCCEGWKVSFSLEDYFRLSTEECSKSLREKIDRGVKVYLHPTPSLYAYVQHDYTGNCPIRLLDGRCAIHTEMGENALAEVCKLYPRGIRKNPYECSCANSCEATLELMFSKDEPIKFIKKILAIDAKSERKIHFDTFGKEEEIRLKLIYILQDRKNKLPTRLMILGLALRDLKNVLEKKDMEEINEFLDKTYEIKKIKYNIDEECLSFGLYIMEEVLKLIDEKSDSVRSYGESALLFFNDKFNFNRYERAKETFEKKIPKWEIWFEHMLVNHMFFEQFPFQDRPEDPWEEFVAICAVYAVLRFLSIGWMVNKTKTSDFVDMASAVFRLIDHTNFDKYASYVLKELKCDTPQKIFNLISL